MAVVKQYDGCFFLIGRLEYDLNFSFMVQSLCSQVVDEIEFIGERVIKEERRRVTLIKYHNEIHYVEFDSWTSSTSTLSVIFQKFSRQLEDTEPLDENFRYFINYYDVFLYYKADELEEAQKMQKELEKELGDEVLLYERSI